jgi:Putative adhesin
MSTLATSTSRSSKAIMTVAIIVVVGIGAAFLDTPVASATTTDETFTMDPGSHVLSVDLGRGDVSLTRSSSTHLEVRRTMRFSGPKPIVEERADANGARITTHCAALTKWVCAISYQIAVPNDYVINVQASSGAVDVRGVIMERLGIEVASGSTHMEDVTGPVKITSASGSITGTRLGVAEFSARLASGRTDLDFAKPPQLVNVAASSGAVTLRLPHTDGAYGVEVHTASGAEEIQVPTDPASEHRVTVSTSSGKVEVLPR